MFTAESAMEALELLNDELPDIILSDYMMPVMLTGYQNGEDLLQVFINENLTAKFVINNLTHAGESQFPDHFNEHFGLLIIAKITDTFTYHFNQTTSHNVFQCIFRLHHP